MQAVIVTIIGVGLVEKQNMTIFNCKLLNVFLQYDKNFSYHSLTVLVLS